MNGIQSKIRKVLFFHHFKQKSSRSEGKARPEQIWCLNNGNLKNEKGEWQSTDSKWSLPDDGKSGLVRRHGCQGDGCIPKIRVLERVVSPETSESKVEFQKEFTVEDLDRQQWYRRKEFENGCFTLSNNQKYLQGSEMELKATTNPKESGKCSY